MDESNTREFFTEANLSNMKEFMEGNGFMVQKKRENPYTCWENRYIYICSNDLPAISKKKDSFDWPALRVRSVFYKSATGAKDTGGFPITAPILAHLFQDLLFR